MKLKCSILFATLLAQSAYAADFELKGYGVHTPTGVTYRYSLLNNTASNAADPWRVLSVEIGRTDPITSYYAKPELMPLPPVEGVYSAGDGVLSVTAPTGWRGYVGGEQEQPNHTIAWEVNKDAQGYLDPATALLPGQTLTGLSVARVVANAAYLNSNFNVRAIPASDPYARRMYSGRVTKQDTLPPTLSVTLTPSTMRSGSRLLSAAATIAATDNYDPLPEIKLESITANQTLSSSDISDALYGTDDRAFKLKPVKNRIYTVTYSATDGSGNKTLASSVVTVR